MWRTKEEKSFFLYETGRELDVLCLGNLVLGDYTNQAQVCIATEDSTDTEMQKLNRSEDEEYNSPLEEEIQCLDDILDDEL